MDEDPGAVGNQSVWLGNSSNPAKVYGVRHQQGGGQTVAFVNDDSGSNPIAGFNEVGNFALHNWSQGEGLYINGVEVGSGTFGDGTPGADPTFSLAGQTGYQIDLFGDERFPDDNPGPGTAFAEVVIYDKPLDATDRALVETYFANKYGSSSTQILMPPGPTGVADSGLLPSIGRLPMLLLLRTLRQPSAMPLAALPQPS